MTFSVFFQTLLEFSENYLNRPLTPEERAKLQNFCNQVFLRQNARQTTAWHKREIQQRIQETLTQLLARVRQELQEGSTGKDREDAPAPVENTAEENIPESQTQTPSE
ncbi:MAG: hypothetical protein LBR88_11325 [Zoogloeaceae bacterium]|jgi:hypothetical protein|nr:hypothetical protein [Zoogloeaceae bacterium]